ncbi:PspC family transcriptional regulator [Vicingus serpentipes]|jgi:phage shock protein C|uniref:PspC family transcriptional regulator n=1 Tax=Vicingus serpentipes TaxID=1926625 RepID=UPI001CB8E088|nr:PspC family transcriptional regulator [Vicingus serpentipes]
MIRKISSFFEKHAFGVCEWWGEKLQLKISRIRLFFIYTSFLTFGSPIIIYLIMAFILEHKEYLKLSKRKTIWDI